MVFVSPPSSTTAPDAVTSRSTAASGARATASASRSSTWPSSEGFTVTTQGPSTSARSRCRATYADPSASITTAVPSRGSSAPASAADSSGWTNPGPISTASARSATAAISSAAEGEMLPDSVSVKPWTRDSGT